MDADRLEALVALVAAVVGETLSVDEAQSLVEICRQCDAVHVQRLAFTVRRLGRCPR